MLRHVRAPATRCHAYTRPPIPSARLNERAPVKLRRTKRNGCASPVTKRGTSRSENGKGETETRAKNTPFQVIVRIRGGREGEGRHPTIHAIPSPYKSVAALACTCARAKCNHAKTTADYRETDSEGIAICETVNEQTRDSASARS